MFVTDRSKAFLLIFIFMLRVLTVCLSVVLVGVFFTYYGLVAAFLVGLLFSFVNEHLDEPLGMLSFPPSIFGSRFWLYLQQHFVIHVLASCDLGFFFYSNPFLIIT